MTLNNEQPKSEKNIVVVDQDMQDLIPDFIKNRFQDIENLSVALKEANYLQIEDIGHRMNGCGASYGFEGLTVIGSSLEKAAKQAHADEIEKGIGNLKDYLDHLEIVYE